MKQQIFLLVGLVSFSSGRYPEAKFTKGGFLMGDYFYKVDNSKERNQADALTFCQSNGGQLATLTGIRLYRIIQAAVPAIGGYWIDGISTTDRFKLTNNCTFDDLSFSGIPQQNVDLSPLACLHFYKGVNTYESKIQLLNCNSALKGVVCSIPLNGCMESTTYARTTISWTTAGTTPPAG